MHMTDVPVSIPVSVPGPAPRQRTPEPAPRQRTPEPAPRERPQVSALPERPQVPAPPSARSNSGTAGSSPYSPQGIFFWGGSRAPAVEAGVGAGAAASEAVQPWRPESPDPRRRPSPRIRHGLPSPRTRHGRQSFLRRPGGLQCLHPGLASRAPTPSGYVTAQDAPIGRGG